MQYRRFGRTELRMPVFSCGGMRYQQTWDDAPLEVVEDENQRNLEATIRRSLELGINHIETARGYGTSERQLGVLFPKLLAAGTPRGDLIVQTKIAPHAEPAVFRQQVEESLERLNLDYVDLLGLHGINTHELLWQSVRPGGCLEVARQLQAEGKVRHVGFSTHGSTELIVDTLRCDAHGGFDYVNLHWYYIFQRNWPAVEVAAERDIGVFIISPTHKGGMLYDPPAKLSRLCKPLHPLVFNCLFCLARPEVHTLSLGASQPSDFDLQMQAVPMVDNAAELLPPIVDRLREAMVEAVGAELAGRYAEGLPAWDDDSPGYMNVPIMLWLRNLALAYDMTEYGKMRYNLLGNGGHWFPGLGAKNLDTLDPDQLTKAFKSSPFADQIVDLLRETEQLLGGTEVKRLSTS
ncbi:MAG: aldo/keto reductase [Planctomycetota bacterium]